MITRILVATDFSEPSEAALSYARMLARQFGASFHLLHVLEAGLTGTFSSEAYIPESPALMNELLQDAKLKLARRLLPSDKALYKATKEVIVGRAAKTIVQYAAEQKFDLIVMGTHGRTGFGHFLVGSVAEHVVRSAPCPVLTVHATGKELLPIEERALAGAGTSGLG
jgi:nucleotide-binding universal stress UspA family protein